jgi:hypothetical protein
MRIGDVLYFSPRIRFSDLDVDDSEELHVSCHYVLSDLDDQTHL